MFGCCLLLKIIFKCVNSTVELNFKVRFVEICTCGSCEQCTELTEIHQTQGDK